MTTIYIRLSIASTILFLVSLICSAYFLFSLPDQFYNSLNVTNSTEIAIISGIINNSRIILGVTASLALLSIILLIVAGQSKSEENIVYINNFKNGGSKTNGNGDQSHDQSDDDSKSAEKLSELKKILSSRTDSKKVLDKALSNICKTIEASQGAIFLTVEENGKKLIRLTSSFAYHIPESKTLDYEFGEGLTGQAAKENKIIKVDSVPTGYVQVFSGLGGATPSHLALVPVKKEDDTLAVVEISSFKEINRSEEDYLQKAAEEIRNYLEKTGEKVKP